MNRNVRFAVLSTILLVALALNVAFPSPALADDSTPPPPDATEPAPTEPPPTEESPTEVAPVATDAAPTETTSDATTSDAADDGSASTALPPDTNLVVLDANGDAVALSTTDAALIMATGDPMWCPSGSSPGDSGCTTPFSNFNGVGGLLDFLQSNPGTYSGAGTIYVASTYSTAGEGGMIVIDSGDGYGLTDLTVQGGWDFGLNQFSGLPTEFNEALQIINWNYDVTLNDLLFDSASGSSSLTVQTTGSIELNDVEVRNNPAGRGASLDNTSGAGTISVNSSSFHDNFTIGIQALSNSDISLTDVDVYDNGGTGAVLDNCDAAVTCNTSLAGTVVVDASSFNNNGYDGLDVSSNGLIYTLDITANSNGQSGISGSGVYLDNSHADDPQNVLMAAYYGNEFNNNLNNGVQVQSQGDITLYDVTANGNGSTSDDYGAGAYLDNTFGDADTFVYNYGEFSNNYADGIDVYSNGNVGLWYVTADNNGTSGNAAPQWGMGAYVYTCLSECDGDESVTVTDSEFNSNYSDGLWATTEGDIELTRVAANDNGNTTLTDPTFGMGAYLDNASGTGGVTISNGEFGNYIAGGNYSNGLTVYSTGDVYLGYVYADNNGNTGNTDTDFGNGAILDACLLNAGACAGTGTVYVFASEFSGNYANGLSAFASDNIVLNYYVSAEENGQGLNVGVGTGAILVNNFTGATGSILLYGPITLNSNYTNGLTAVSNGNIYMTGVDASDNGTYGAAAITTSGNVTVDPSTFDSNTDSGLIVNAYGEVALNGVQAGDNGDYGASIISTNGGATIQGSAFDVNTTSGIQVSAPGDIAVSNSEANTNGSFGAVLTTSAGAVSIEDGQFNSNTGFGLDVGAADDISLASVEAGGNGSFGALLATSSGDISLDTVQFNSNTNFGLNAGAAGDITATDVVASDNGSFGALLTSSGGSVSLTSGAFDSNTSYGLNIGAAGDVTLNKVRATENGSFGALVTTSVGNVTIDVAAFDSNTGFGLSVGSTGDASLADVSASDNGGFGATISATSGGVSIDPSLFNSNTGYGLAVNATGNVFLGGVQADSNGMFGAALDSSTGSVSVDTGNFIYNANSGLISSAAGDISLAQVSANHNGGAGAALSAGGRVFVLDSGNFDWNSLDGLSITSALDTSIEDISASNNGGAGASVTANGILVTGGIFANNGGDGLSLASTNWANVICTAASDNTGFGIDANLPGVLFTMQPSLVGNSAGPVDVTGGGIWVNKTWGCVNVPHLPPPLPWNVIHVTTGDAQTLNCTEYGGTVLILPNWDHVALPCPIGDEASLTSVPADQLPGTLGDSYTYLSGLDVEVRPALNGTMTIDFLIPPAELNSPLIILHWDGTQWTDRGGMPTKDNFFEITSSETGTYLLVSQ